MIFYENAMGMRVRPLFLVAGDLNLSKVIQYQGQNGWLLCYTPASFFLFLVSAFADSNPLPGLSASAETFAGGLLHIGIFAGKMLVLMLVFIWVRWMLPRFRYDQLMDLGWRRFIPLALANILFYAGWFWMKS